MSIPIKYNSENIIEGISPIVILGPNGSGKTRYGLQLADWNNADTIAALRDIALAENVPMQSLSQAEQELNNHKRQRKKRPWNIASEINNLFAKLMAEDSASAIEFRDRYQEENARPETTKLMRLSKAWHYLFPGRHIEFKGYTPRVTSEYVAGETAYPAQQMSDGERVALYLAGRVLDSNPGVILIDELEVHFHSRLAIQFWDELERLRSDCRFVYITHDLTFARSRSTNDFLIVRPGNDPELIDLAGAGIPPDISESILSAASFSIFANRLIFCEGTESSYDQKLLRAWFNERTDAVIPVGSCRDVIRCATTFCESNILSGVTALGIIDCDYWPDTFLTSLPTGISILPVHEIESIFCIKPVFILLAKHMGKNATEANRLHEDFLNEAKLRFANELLLKQISERFRCRCEDQVHKAMNVLNVSGTETEVRANHCSALSPENWNVQPETIFEEEKCLIENALNSTCENFLKVLPGKVYFPILVEKLGLSRASYVDLIADSLRSKEGDNLYELGRNIRTSLGSILPNA